MANGNRSTRFFLDLKRELGRTPTRKDLLGINSDSSNQSQPDDSQTKETSLTRARRKQAEREAARAEAAKAKQKTLTVDSGDFANQTAESALNQTAFGQPQSFAQTFQQVQDLFQPLGEQRRAEIRQDVEAAFAPRFAEQARVNELRSNIERAQSAQRGQTGFGAGRLAAQGQVNVAQAGADAVNRLRQLQEAEVNARIQAAESTDFKRTQDFLALANTLQREQRAQAQDFFNRQIASQREQRLQEQHQLQRGVQQLDLISELGPEQLAEFGATSFEQLETNLGLPAGFVDALRATKADAAKAESDEARVDLFNKGTQLALGLPQGQSFELVTPDGEILQFTGSEPDAFQIVSNKRGIFRVNKNTGEVQQVQQFAGGGGGSTGDQSGLSDVDTFAGFVLDQIDLSGDRDAVLLGINEAVNDLPLSRDQKAAVLQSALGVYNSGGFSAGEAGGQADITSELQPASGFTDQQAQQQNQANFAANPLFINDPLTGKSTLTETAINTNPFVRNIRRAFEVGVDKFANLGQ